MPEIAQMTYAQVRESAAAVEVMSFDRLRRLNDGGTQRADFHVLCVVESGAGEVSVDFARHRLAPRSVAWIRPGAVHRWDDMARVRGTVVLFTPTAPVTRATRETASAPAGATAWRESPAQWHLTLTAVRHLQAETAALTGDARSEIPTLLVSALLARLAPPPAGPATTGRLFEAFQAQVETGFRDHHDVGHYARALGYVPRTLSRAVHQATGASAKAYLTGRLVLEAKRLLAHDALPVHRTAAALGFRDTSTFSAFFRTATGERPSMWQRRHLTARATETKR